MLGVLHENQGVITPLGLWINPGTENKQRILDAAKDNVIRQ